MPARANIKVSSEATPRTDTSLDKLKSDMRAEVGRLINRASDLGGDGYYRQAIRCESTATALLDVLDFIRTGRFPHTGEETTRGTTISEDLAARFRRLPEA